MIRTPLCLALLCILPGCGGETPAAPEEAAAKVGTTGKSAVALADVPPAVLAAAAAARPGFTAAEAEAETREGRLYFDIGGRLADGSEVEFDIMEEGGRWRVVETQRDIAYPAAPAPVRAAAARHDAALAPTRVIESRQEDGLILYELYAPRGGDPQGRKVEVKWDGARAEVLTKEWAH